MSLALALAPALIPAAAPAQEGPPQRGGKLADIERDRKASERRAEELARAAEQAAREARDLSEQLVAVAAEAQTHERAIAEQNDLLATLTAERETRGAALAARRARLSELLAALERIARHPPEALLAYGRTPQDTLRAAMLLREAVPKIEEEAGKLRGELETLAEIGEQAAARSEALARESNALEGKRQTLARLLERKRALARATKEERDLAQARAQALASEAKDLRELLAGIERERAAEAKVVLRRPPSRQPAIVLTPPPPKAEGTPTLATPPAPPRPGTVMAGLPVSGARGRLTAPVSGRVAAAFGAPEDAGESKGVRFAAAPAAQVVAPYGGEVVFSGPFRSYGLLLIIDHGEGYHSLLAGFGRVDAVVGQNVLAGEPVGVMPGRANGPIRLYMEWRRGGRAIDPSPWLATPPNSKVSG